MCASALCIYACMSACSARPSVHETLASARQSVRLMSVYPCACRFIFCPSICLILRLSVCISVCLYACTYVGMTVQVYVL